MIQAGLIGTPLGHSASAAYFAQHHPDCCYRAHEMVSLEGLRQWVEEERLDGFNVTIPYKRAIIEHLDAVDDTARRIGAVNCVRVQRKEGRTILTGYNTDYQAFAETLQPMLQPWHRRALVLGTGGAAQAVGFALQKLGIDHTFVSRTPKAHPKAIGYDQLPSLLLPTNPSTLQPTIIINATPVGMWPNTAASPMPDIQGIGPQHLCYDLIYNPEKTRWLHEATQRGATTCNGTAMLHRQADFSLERWRQTDFKE